jgi:vacuolar-type H+-ATPase subunit I/STV1
MGEIYLVDTKSAITIQRHWRYHNEAKKLNVVHGTQLVAKIRNICESLGATLYAVDEDSGKRRDGMEVAGRIEDLNRVLDNTRNARRIELAKYVCI